MKVCYIADPGKVPKLTKTLYVRISGEGFDDAYYQYKDIQGALCLVVSPDVPTSGLLKFVEDYTGDLSVVVYSTPDLVFLSRFHKTVVKRTLHPSKAFALSSLEEALKECKEVLVKEKEARHGGLR